MPSQDRHCQVRLTQVRPRQSRPLSRVIFASLLIVCAASPAFAQSVTRADVNRDCTVTSADAALVQAALGKRTGSPDTARMPTSTAMG